MTAHLANEMKTTLKWVGEARTQSHHKSYPQHGDPKLGENSTQSFSLRREGLEPQIGHLNFFGLHLKLSPPNI